MIFKLDIKSAQKNFLNRNGTAILKFFKDDKTLNKEVQSSLSEYNVSLSKIQMDGFTKDRKAIWHYNPNSAPDLIIFKKIIIKSPLTSAYRTGRPLFQRGDKKSIQLIAYRL